MTATITKARLATLTPSEAAALFIVQQDKGTPVEVGVFEAWLAQSEENQAAWDAAAGAWSMFDDADDPAFAALRVAALADVPSEQANLFRTHWRPIAAAASLVAVVTGALLLGRGSDQPTQLASATGPNAAGRLYSAPANAPAQFLLADGTRMLLDRNARASVAMTTDRRLVLLEDGSATFTVRHDTSRPFSVAAKGHTIVDVGTKFRVALQQDGLRVALYEGSVRVNDRAGHVTMLRPGEELVARSGQRDKVVATATDGSGAAGLVQFDNVTLAAAAEMINQGSNDKLVIDDPSISRLRVSGRFRLREPERFARNASDLLSLRVVRVSRFRIELRRHR